MKLTTRTATVLATMALGATLAQAQKAAPPQGVVRRKSHWAPSRTCQPYRRFWKASPLGHVVAG